MKILIATDSFKDCLSAKEVGLHLKKGLLLSDSDLEVKILPMADGGEGTVRALVDATEGEIIHCEVHDALMREIDSFYGILGDKKTAVIEMAAASGIEHLKQEERNAWITSTYGTGELIAQALDRNCTRIVIGIGGSATNDGGFGMAKALGAKFLRADGSKIADGGGALDDLVHINLDNFDKRIKHIEIIVACDVSNPLTGKNGASYVYGPQKGADVEMVEKLDSNLNHYASILKEVTGLDVEFVPGAGAAGGLGAGLLAFCNGTLKKGIDIVANETGLVDHCKWADLVITGEGKMDSQTQYGKTPQGVCDAAKKFNLPVVGIAGTLGDKYEELYASGFNAILSIVDGPMSLDEALKKAPELLQQIGFTIGSMLEIHKKSD